MSAARAAILLVLALQSSAHAAIFVGRPTGTGGVSPLPLPTRPGPVRPR